MQSFEEKINHIIASLPEEIERQPKDTLMSEALLAIQRTLEEAKVIKSALVHRQATNKVGKLLLLCVKLEIINSELRQVRHEYNL